MFADSDHLMFAAEQVKLARRSLGKAIRHLKRAQRHLCQTPSNSFEVDAATHMQVEQMRTLLDQQINTLTEQIEQRLAAQEITEQCSRFARLLRILERSQPDRPAPTDKAEGQQEP
ncbi:MAG TPA: hypothetical protein VFA10_26190 [Ktedonobacteraceae bacterium]|nr:hypothetical protein [Ktedonobacteraceae bacterium]